ncbi:MAG: M18 family aminopeptidase, partial [Erysipelotrichaceae bacterium]|nr:M18 family aminopeptidase [Erysipelotrichaceae bacterium]
MTKAENMIQFLNKCHSAYHATAAIEEELRDAGFIRLKESEPWKLESNRYYYVIRNDTSIIAFKIPEMVQVKSLNIVASHSDSPCLKIKPVSKLDSPNGYGRLNVEMYGGAIMSTWLDRPLSIAGRAVIKEEGRLVSHLIDFDENMAIIPNVAIHQNREINNGYKWDAHTDMVPMVSLEKDEKFLVDKIAEHLGVMSADVCSYDLFMYNRTEGCVWGQNNEFISSPRLDDLECAYTSLQAFKHSYSEHSVNMYAVFDNEEVGSMSRQGMASTFLEDTITRIFASFFYNKA